MSTLRYLKREKWLQEYMQKKSTGMNKEGWNSGHQRARRVERDRLRKTEWEGEQRMWLMSRRVTLGGEKRRSQKGHQER
jgi:hypothetical protein